MSQPALTPNQAFNRGSLARDRYHFSRLPQEPDSRVLSAGLEQDWLDGYHARSTEYTNGTANRW